jgi:hypothetical protein
MASNRRWRLQFRYRGSRHESAVAQLFSLGFLTHYYEIETTCRRSHQDIGTFRFHQRHLGFCHWFIWYMAI